jgi:hypothetical protein
MNPLTDESHPLANKAIAIAKANRGMIGVTA